MTTHAGLSVIGGGKDARDGRYLVVGEGMIISMVGLHQLFDQRGISLNKLHKTLDRVREGRLRVDWYALRDSLEYLVNDGRLVATEGKPMTMPWQHGQRTVLYRLADWEEWWRITCRML